MVKNKICLFFHSYCYPRMRQSFLNCKPFPKKQHKKTPVLNEKYLVHKSIDLRFSQASYEAFVKKMPGLILKFQGYFSLWDILLALSLVTVLSFSKVLSSFHTILILIWSKPNGIFVYPSIKSDKNITLFCSSYTLRK